MGLVFLMNNGAAILLTFVAVFVTLGLGYLFFFLIKRNIAKEKEESEIIVEDAITRRQMEDSINLYIKTHVRHNKLNTKQINLLP